MKVVLQRVTKASVTIESKTVGQIGLGFVVLLGAREGDGEKQVDYLVDKIINLRVFSDEQEKMNLSLIDVNGSLLVVSQFTLYANCDKGRRPSFIGAGDPDEAKKLYELFVQKARDKGVQVETGEFGAMMDVELINSGPVTIVLEN